MIEDIKNALALNVAYLLPPRVIMWAVIRAFAHTSKTEFNNKHPDKISYTELAKSWDKLIYPKSNDK